jgi:putative SOS response-associated peptidase YedK
VCGRYTLSISNRPELNTLGLQATDRYNIAPQSQVMTVIEDHDFDMQRWGLELVIAGGRCVVSNARSETLLEKRSFRSLPRCAFVADGWYEWQRTNGARQPWYHHMEGRLLYFAGVYDPGNGCAMVTESADQRIRHIHSRQPMLLGGEDLELWMRAGARPARQLASPIDCYPVAQKVGNARIEGPELIQPISSLEMLEGQTNDLFD